MSYTEKEIIDLFETNRPYQKDCVNYTGKTSSGEYYNEVIAKLVLKKSFTVYPYTKNLKTKFCHSSDNINVTVKSEKGLCRRFFSLHNFIDDDLIQKYGEPIDYEINLVEGTKINVDLISINREEKSVYLIEVKGKVSTGNDFYSTSETLLRCALEIETYYETLIPNKDKLLSDIFKSRKIDENPENYTLKKGILIPSDSFCAYQAVDENGMRKFKNVNQVLNKYDISVCVFDKYIYKKFD